MKAYRNSPQFWQKAWLPSNLNTAYTVVFAHEQTYPDMHKAAF